MVSDIYVKMDIDNRYGGPEYREKVAKFVADTINAGATEGFPRESTINPRTFILNKKEDWMILFDDNDDSIFRITNSKWSPAAIIAISTWIAFQLNAELVTRTKG